MFNFDAPEVIEWCKKKSLAEINEEKKNLKKEIRQELKGVKYNKKLLEAVFKGIDNPCRYLYCVHFTEVSREAKEHLRKEGGNFFLLYVLKRLFFYDIDEAIRLLPPKREGIEYIKSCRYRPFHSVTEWKEILERDGYKYFYIGLGRHNNYIVYWDE